jgi:hypothetical protein
MILQGTDGQSRGIWASALHVRLSQSSILASIFAPSPFHPGLVSDILHGLRLPTDAQWQHHQWEQEWDASALFHHLSVWFPPPELAQQLTTFVLEAWVECPLTTSALFVVPRTLQKAWHGLSKHLHEIAHIPPATLSGYFPLVLPSYVLTSSRPYSSIASQQNRQGSLIRQGAVPQATSRQHARVATFRYLPAQSHSPVTSMPVPLPSMNKSLYPAALVITVDASESGPRSGPVCARRKVWHFLKLPSGPILFVKLAPSELC